MFEIPFALFYTDKLLEQARRVCFAFTRGPFIKISSATAFSQKNKIPRLTRNPGNPLKDRLDEGVKEKKKETEKRKERATRQAQ